MALVKCKQCGNENAKDARTCPKCGTSLKMGLGKKVLIGFGALILLAAIGNAGKNDQARVAQGSLASSPVSNGATDDSQPTNDPVALSEKEATLTFGKPTVKGMGGGIGMTKVMVEASNSSRLPVSCMVTATFKKGDTILATANGALNSVPPGTTRTAELMTMDKIIGYDTLKLEASTCFNH
jgi:hypothetical protein